MRRDWVMFGRKWFFIATTFSWEQQELLPRLRVQRLTGSSEVQWGIGIGWLHGWVHFGWNKTNQAEVDARQLRRVMARSRPPRNWPTA